ncbi:putative permease [Nocardia brasiliensis NBRC 14402]|uniref:ZIP family metal transporter n=1 Tax=Nocardia brasiliensis TaxID=37326 RepID=UPI00045C3DC6|nr:ZIP family metal transporter [Nocardia brasiliensis]ASF11292.1 permease [Nocardia brasiliensis]GAJ86950.1 putative permease [Nocardia brasiliensis NBRC 14402]SUB09988.1 zinc transporter ZupT [Nocardia brasiliensis]
MAILLALVSMCSTLVGGFVAVRIGDRRHLVLGLAAGVMLGVVFFDLIPEALEQSEQDVLGVPAVLIAAVGGFLTIHVIERAVAIHTGHEQEFGTHTHGFESVGVLAAAGLIFHSFLDGLGIGLGFQAGATVGAAVAIAVISHDFADGFNTFTISTLYGNARKRALTLLGLDAVAPVIGAVVGTLIQVPEGMVGLYLGYFGGFLLYLATADILPEAHAVHPSRLTLACTVLGAALMFVVAALNH